MNIAVALKLDSLLRDLRLTGHALAEAAEQEVLRAIRRESAAPRRPGQPGTREREGKRP